MQRVEGLLKFLVRYMAQDKGGHGDICPPQVFSVCLPFPSYLHHPTPPPFLTADVLIFFHGDKSLQRLAV